MVSHRSGRPAVWCKAPAGAQAILIGADADRFFAPPYVGPKGWIGIHLDRRVDWREVAFLIARSYRLTAPKRLTRATSAG
jgi:predicted DNA-binding protein (MmcQ/YjbR family)